MSCNHTIGAGEWKCTPGGNGPGEDWVPPRSETGQENCQGLGCDPWDPVNIVEPSTLPILMVGAALVVVWAKLREK
jgi:hypothetical protein